MTQVIIGLVRLTFARPRDGFQAVLDLAPSIEARWLAVAIIAVLNVMITQATLIGVPPETMPAWVYCAIISPLSTPGSSARNGGSPCERARSSIRSVRRSAIEPRSAATIARKSRT